MKKIHWTIPLKKFIFQDSYKYKFQGKNVMSYINKWLIKNKLQQFVGKLLPRSFWNKLQVKGKSCKPQEKVLSCYNKLQKQATDNKQQVVYRFPASAAK